MSRQFKPVAVMRLPWGEDLEMVSGSLGTTAATLATGRDVFLSAKGDHPWSHPLYRIIHEYEFMWVTREIEFLPQAHSLATAAPLETLAPRLKARYRRNPLHFAIAEAAQRRSAPGQPPTRETVAWHSMAQRRASQKSACTPRSRTLPFSVKS